MKLCECGCGRSTTIYRGVPRRFIRGHAGRILGDRFVIEDRGYVTPCRIWTGAADSSGYGHRARDGQKVRVSREEWERVHGPIPAGMCVLHRCDVPACAEVSHLFLGTQIANLADMRRKGRHKGPPTLTGEANPRAKLTADQVVAIRASAESGPVLAARYGVSRSTVSRIRLGRRWGSMIRRKVA